VASFSSISKLIATKDNNFIMRRDARDDKNATESE